MEDSSALEQEIANLDSIIQEQVKTINEKLAANNDLCELEDDAGRLSELLYIRSIKQQIVEQLSENVTA